jgi:small ligand-binding sensory domain FIST
MSGHWTTTVTKQMAQQVIQVAGTHLRRIWPLLVVFAGQQSWQQSWQQSLLLLQARRAAPLKTSCIAQLKHADVVLDSYSFYASRTILLVHKLKKRKDRP